MNVKLDINTLYMKTKIFVIIFTLFVMNNLNGQILKDSVKTDSSLSGQFRILVNRSKSQGEYKLIHPNRLSLFWKNVKDSLADIRIQYLREVSQHAKYQTEIASLKEQISGTQASLTLSNARLNEISFLGLNFDKKSYSALVWGIIVILIVILLFTMFRSARNVREARHRTALFEEVTQEYQTYKIKANEKEKKLARELQDERNKLEELRNLR